MRAHPRTLGHVLSALALGLLLTACAGRDTRVEEPGAAEPVDGPSTRDIRPEDVKDAVPRAEPLARYGNHSPYQVFGRTYHVMPSSKGYRERGVASWYGSKFHGRRTSSGEPYDMHLATAAHKSLPLPTYAEVTNLENGRRIVLKINDRGPFKDGRIIDLSYGAALRLGVVQTGTARVEVRAIDVDGGERYAAATPAPAATESTWLQAGAYAQRESADALASRLERDGISPVSVHDGGDLFRVWLGPYASASEVDSVIRRAIELGFERPHRVKR